MLTEWQANKVDRAEVLRLIYQGRFLHENVSLDCKFLEKAMRFLVGWISDWTFGTVLSFKHSTRKNMCYAFSAARKNTRAEYW